MFAQNNVFKLMTIFVCVHERVRGGGRECNQHILHLIRISNCRTKRGS